MPEICFFHSFGCLPDAFCMVFPFDYDICGNRNRTFGQNWSSEVHYLFLNMLISYLSRNPGFGQECFKQVRIGQFIQKLQKVGCSYFCGIFVIRNKEKNSKVLFDSQDPCELRGDRIHSFQYKVLNILLDPVCRVCMVVTFLLVFHGYAERI